MPRTQLYRPIGIGTPLGDDVLLITSAQISERLGQMFHIEVMAVAGGDEQPISFKKIIGQNVTLRMALKDGGERYWNGYVSEFAQGGMSGHLQQYRMTIVPWIWFLGRTANFRCFQNKSVPDIIMSIFKDGGFTDYSFKLNGPHGPWEYCVQYRETDLNFISRLMEQEGIYYYFTHESGKHTMVVTDNPDGHQPYAQYASIAYRPHVGGGGTDKEYITDWSIEQRLQPSAYETMDYDFKDPKKMLKSRTELSKGHTAGKWEVFDYPGEWDNSADGDHFTLVRLEELLAEHEVAHASTNARGIAAGHLFTLQDFDREDQNIEHLITSASISLSTNDYSSGEGDGQTSFSCTFTAIDAQTQYRSPRVTPKPVIQGPQTAVVVGPVGEEIHTDKYGRVKVQFHWDRYGKRDENSSCWIRVAQNWAGRKWGSMFIPRIGMEVIVQFIEGDPDVPIITGCVYNGDQMPPYALPANSTRTTLFKSNSSKGGGKFNEFRIEDKAGSEQIFINASKDYDCRVKNVTKEFVGVNRHMIVGGDQLEKVAGDKHLQVKGDQNEKIGGTVSLETGMDLQQKVGMKHALEATMESHIKAGMNVTIEAGLMITLKAGASFITLSPAGVTIVGMPLTLINSGGAAGQGAGCTVAPPKDPAEADTAEPGEKIEPLPPPVPPKPVKYGSQAKVLKQAAISGTPFCEKCAAAAEAAKASGRQLSPEQEQLLAQKQEWEQSHAGGANGEAAGGET